MAEAFTMQRYFQYDTLRDLGLAHFDSWAQMYADYAMPATPVIAAVGWSLLFLLVPATRAEIQRMTEGVVSGDLSPQEAMERYRDAVVAAL